MIPLKLEELVNTLKINEGCMEGNKHEMVWTYIKLLTFEIVDEEEEK